MHTFAQKENQSEQKSSANLIRSSTPVPAVNHQANPLLNLQRTIGNQAVLRLLQARADDLEARSRIEVDSESRATGRFAHDFSRIPFRAPAPVTIQPKLAINTPGDVYEQEAEHVAEQVMRMPEPRLQRSCPCGGGCPRCQTAQTGQEHQSLQTKHVGSSEAGQTAAPPIVHQVLAAPGQPLDMATRAFMEPRFGHDFSQVRVHTDAKAAESARAVNALAYTVGRDVSFGRGQYAPETNSGKKLVAHELTHVMQQGYLRNETAGHVQRFTEQGHKMIGDEAFGDELLTLGPGLQMTYGDAVAMGDYFGSFEQMKRLAEKPGKGPGTQGEVRYVLLVKIRHERVEDCIDKAYNKDAVHVRDQASNSLDTRNISHFPNPLVGDATLDPLQKNQRKDQVGPFGAAATYRQGHEQAMQLAYNHGIKRDKMEDATLADAFACHFLTDSFSASHVRTPRASIKEYWDKRVPAFQQKFIQWLADRIEHAYGPGKRAAAIAIPFVPVVGTIVGTVLGLPFATVRTAAAEQLSLLLSPSDHLSFGNVASLIVHDVEGAATVEATIDGKPITLAGDKGLVTEEVDPVTKRPKPSTVIQTESAQQTFAASVRAVKASQEDLYVAYEAGWNSKKFSEAYQKAIGPERLYTAERLVPTPIADSLLPADKRSLSWMQKSVGDFLAQNGAGLVIWADSEAAEFEKRLNEMKDLKPEAKDAINKALIVPLKSKNPKTISDVILSVIAHS
jgi:hypothetical protein